MAHAADYGEEIAFGPFRVDVRGRVLYRDGISVPLGARSFDILCVLVALRGNLVTKDELRARIWAGMIVEENTIHVHVSALRKALGDGGTGQRYIVTAAGQGYRFVGDIAQASLPPLPEQPSIAVLISTGILCVECKACGKRSMLTRRECRHLHPGNKTEVRSVTFRCSRQDCGSTDVRRYGGCDHEEAETWRAGDPMDPIREIPDKAAWETWNRGRN